MDIWFVDDRAANRATWLASFPHAVREACVFRVFGSVPEFLTALEAGDWPDIVFIDFFLGHHTGLEVVERFAKDGRPTPLLVAHSSMMEANDALVRAGAHLAMAKTIGAARTRSITEAIGSVEDLRRLIEEHRPG